MTQQREQVDALPQGEQQADTGQQRAGTEILPALAKLQQQMVEAVRKARNEAPRQEPVFEQVRTSQPADEQQPVENGKPKSPGEQGPTAALTLTIDGRQIEQGMRALLDGMVDALSSDALRHTVQQRSQESLRSTITRTRKAVPEKSIVKKMKQQTDQMLSETLEGLFSGAIRDEDRRDGERIIRELLRGDVPSARREGERALQLLVERRIDLIQQHWERVVQVVLQSVLEASEEKAETPKAEAGTESGTEQAATAGMPQTVSRSDKRAQSIWQRAHDRAAEKNGKGRSAERAAYEALKLQYEKKGDRWVRKRSGGQLDSAPKKDRTARRK